VSLENEESRPVLRATLIAAILTTAVFTATAFAGCWGSSRCPIRIQMARGTDTIVLTGRTHQNVECCDYVFRARAGQMLSYRVEGAALRTVLTYPNGDVDGPGVPNPVQLPSSGVYTFGVHPNLMADGAFGRYRLTLTIR
jgi:hypothetical protein